MRGADLQPESVFPALWSGVQDDGLKRARARIAVDYRGLPSIRAPERSWCPMKRPGWRIDSSIARWCSRLLSRESSSARRQRATGEHAAPGMERRSAQSSWDALKREACYEPGGLPIRAPPISEGTVRGGGGHSTVVRRARACAAGCSRVWGPGHCAGTRLELARPSID